MKLVDADVILRFLLSDNPEKALKRRNLLLSSDEYLHITELALAEVIWVMESSYGVSKEDIASRTLRLVSSPRIDFTDRELLEQALVLYREHNVSFIDAYHTALGRRAGHEVIYSYNRDFERLKFPRLEP